MENIADLLLFDLLLKNLLRVSIISYPFLLFFFYKNKNSVLLEIVGGLVMRSAYLLIILIWVVIGAVQYMVGCDHLFGECYKESLSAGYWWLLKDISAFFEMIWIAAFLSRFVRQIFK